MLKKLMLGTAASTLMLSGAMAQTPTSPAQPMSPPAASSTPSSAPAASAPDTSSSTAAGASSKASFVSSQQPDQILASKFKGTSVLGSDGKKVGDVSDILFDKSGKIEAYVISVGGFLGVGSKSVAMAPSSFEVVAGENGAAPKLKTAMTTNELKQAQNFTPYEPPHTTTGSGGGLSPRPSGSTRPMSGSGAR